MAMAGAARMQSMTESERHAADVTTPAASPALEPDFSSVFAEHARSVWRMARSLGVHESDVEDVCQDVFMVVHRKLENFEQRSSVRTWLYGIVLRVVSDYRKKAHRKRERLVAEPPPRTHEASPEGCVADQQALAMLDSVLEELSEERRQVFVLYEIEQLSMREIAEALDCPLQTVYSRHQSARAIVQRRLAAHREGGARR
jgi:RNA polymerase sigma-70 factor, ECF subfamily